MCDRAGFWGWEKSCSGRFNKGRFSPAASDEKTFDYQTKSSYSTKMGSRTCELDTGAVVLYPGDK